MEAKLLSYKNLHLWHHSSGVPIHHYEGPQAEKDMYYNDRPYLRNGIKVARNYVDGVGQFARYAIFHLD